MCKILVINDSTLLNKRISKSLEKEDYLTSTTTSAAHGLEILKKNETDLLIMEILMPDISGFEIISRIKKMNHEVKIIAMTSGGIINVDDYLSAIKSFGADMVLKKPFRDGYLIRMVGAILKGQQNFQESGQPN